MEQAIALKCDKINNLGRGKKYLVCFLLIVFCRFFLFIQRDVTLRSEYNKLRGSFCP